VGEEGVLLAGVYGHFRNGRKLAAVVFQNAVASGDALLTDIRSRIVTGARNELRNRFLRFMAKRATQAARLRIGPSHVHLSSLENTAGRAAVFNLRIARVASRALAQAQVHLTSNPSMWLLRRSRAIAAKWGYRLPFLGQFLSPPIILLARSLAVGLLWLMQAIATAPGLSRTAPPAKPWRTTLPASISYTPQTCPGAS
jgi:hypothetical protein